MQEGRLPCPWVRIDLIKGRSEAQPEAIAQAVYDAMHAVGVPLDDRFEVITERDPANLVSQRSYLGIAHTDDLVIVQITFNEGRTTAQKKALYKGIAEAFTRPPGSGWTTCSSTWSKSNGKTGRSATAWRNMPSHDG